uniref:Uncharacterized protein n=1 Tax=Arundo donax TaxID=35708 RepID=A0A0A8YWU3_ARUDO
MARRTERIITSSRR